MKVSILLASYQPGSAWVVQTADTETAINRQSQTEQMTALQSEYPNCRLALIEIDLNDAQVQKRLWGRRND